MKSRAKFLLTCVTGLLISGTGPIISPSYAADVAMPTKAPAIEPLPVWWYAGELEVGGRFFVNNPQNGGIASEGGKSLGKFYEYRDLRPGPIGNFYLGTGTNNGLYQIEAWGNNVGYRDQRYDLSASKAGEHYLDFQWDETPHDYGTGHTIYNGIGSNALTLPAGLSNTLFNDSGCVYHAGSQPTGCGSPNPNPSKVQTDIENNLHNTDIAIRRDTAAVGYRWTPTSEWDIKADYSNMHRTGTQVEGVVMSWGTSGVRVDAAMPVHDTTQNYGLNGEYAGTSPWGQKFTVKLAYSGSTYKDDNESYTVQNPFCATGSGPGECARNGSNSSPLAMMSLWPDNHSNGFSGTLAADLPLKSRYMGTVSYNMMRQNENFLPFTISNLGLDPVNGQPWNSTAALPATSLNGAINTLMSNNVLTTQITPELKSKLSYRYFDFNNDTPEILVPQWIGADVNIGPTSSSYHPVQSLSISYKKQNAGAELNWRPDHQWNFGAAYGYEQYDWTRADVDTTHENSGKVYADWKPWSWLTARASWLYSERRYDNYNYLNYVGNAQWPPGASTLYSTAYRQFYLDNRDRNKARFSLSVDLLRNLTVTPTVGLQNDDFKLDQSTEVGLLRDHAWNAGADLIYVMSPDTKFLFAYLYEHRSELVSSAGGGTPPFSASSYYTADVAAKVNTFIVAVDHALIPNTLDLHFGYTTSLATLSQPLYFANGTGPSSSTGGQYPDIKTTFQRLEAVAKYTFDDSLVRQLGWKGKITAKLGYAYERNSVDNWQLDILAPYTGGAPYCPTSFSCGYMLWMANDNPNYNVHQIVASLAFKW